MAYSIVSSQVNMPAHLPIDDVLPDLKQTLAAQPIVLLAAAPGAGKTTRVPLALLTETWLADKKILMLEPRRMAARNAAEFMAHSLGEKAGQTVGYRIRLDSQISTSTRIEVVTEGILTRLLQSDPELNDYGLVIFDEFHERNLHSDLGLALAHHCQQMLREDLKLLIMSATLDDQRLQDIFSAPLIESAGRSFPIDIHYRPANNSQTLLSEQITTTVLEALQHDGDILVFLPGIKEIKQCQQALENLPNDCLVLPLHGQLKDNEQKRVLANAPTDSNGQPLRKIILATNIAESSLTIDGVRIVIDSGLERRNEFQLSTGLSILTTKMISQASSIQRAGRAGRQASGICFRLWAENQQSRLEPHIRPEILDADLAPLLTELYQWGATADELFWLTPPPSNALNQAQQLLAQLNMLNADASALSEHGQQVAALPLEPRWGHALITLSFLGFSTLACELVAVLQEFPHTLRHSDDLNRLYEHAKRHSLWKQRIEPLAKRLQLLLHSTAQQSTAHISVHEQDLAALLLALAYPDRIAKRRANSEHFLLANGRGATLSAQSDFLTATWLACADLTSSRSSYNAQQNSMIRVAAELPEYLLTVLKQLSPTLFSQTANIQWQTNGQLLAASIEYLGKIEISRTLLPKLNAEEWQLAWKDYIQQQGLGCLTWTEDALQLKQRLLLAYQTQPDHWPDVADETLLTHVENWLLPFLSDARNLRDLAKLDVSQALISLLDYSQQQELNRLLPTHFKVPSGSNIALDYTQNPPVLAVKLQEMFGYEGQPSLLNGQLQLNIHLLSPARRPIQITADLPHFWRNTYSEVRKDLRGRYPKHPWPEDPLNAEATHLTKNKLQQRNQS